MKASDCKNAGRKERRGREKGTLINLALWPTRFGIWRLTDSSDAVERSEKEVGKAQCGSQPAEHGSLSPSSPFNLVFALAML